MTVAKLMKQNVHVLGPLEWSPNQFAVGERSYAAIVGNWPRYNAIRQQLYTDGQTEIADAIGELEARAKTAEAALDEAEASRKRFKALLEGARTEAAQVAEAHAKKIAALEEKIDQLKSKK